MDKETWIRFVEYYNGAFVLWIDQGSDPLIIKANIDGVCFAMSFDFVTAYQMGQPGPSNFVNVIRNASLRLPVASRIPLKYVEMQAASQEMLDQFRATLIELKDQFIAAEENNKQALLLEIKKLLENRINQRFGPGMDAFIKFKELNVLASQTILNKMKAIVAEKGPSYFLVSMRGETGGHAIAFGFRPDLSASANFGKIYEYFDANLGLFVFGSEASLSEFFNVNVWTGLYGDTDYTKFEIASFTAYPKRR